jgi:hypothetical protein
MVRIAETNPCVPALEPPQTVRFTESLDNIVAFNVYRALNNPVETASRRNARRGSVYILVIVILFLISKMLPFFLGETPSLDIPSILLILIGLSFVWLVWRSTSPRRIPDALKGQFKAMVGEASLPSIEIPCEMTIDAIGIAIVEAHGSRRLAWPAIEKVVIEPHYLFLLLSPIQAVVVPRTAFPSEHAYLGFANLAKQLLQVHGPKPAAQ